MNKLRHMAEMSAREALGWLEDTFLLAAVKAEKEGLPALWLPSATIDPDLYTELIRSLVHIARNAADHGLELPEDRETLGKPRAGRLTIQLELRDDTYLLVISDDGAGVDVVKVAAKAVQLGLPSPRSREDTFELLFRDGFSTKDTVSALSGRGVGLSAVRSEARKLGGNVLIDSIAGKGTQFTVRFKRQEPWIKKNETPAADISSGV
jgi:chemotaxis protein histidine kinase CheA